ncbi:hypothetical protein F4604DRAFT_1923534 [Suillus subluteus]|nr:hypothetical protein F4604DRAFT_1923534 [Suillus subluteus]
MQESYQHIATLEVQMQADQDAVHVDAPKPKCPCACPVGKAAKASKTSNLTMDGGQAGAEIVIANKPVVTKGKGHKGRARQGGAGSNQNQEEKVSKLLVRDVIEAVSRFNTGVAIDRLTKARDGDVHQKTSDILKKITLAGRILGWISKIPTTSSKPSSTASSKATRSSVCPWSTTSVLSKLTRGSTISSNVPPPSTPISTEGFTSNFSNLYASDEDEDEDEELFTKPISHLTGKNTLTLSLIISLNNVLPSNITHHGVTLAPELPDLIEDADDIEILSDIPSQLIVMNSDIGDSTPVTQLDFLGDYKSNSDASHELQAVDHDSDLEPPPLTQNPTSHSIFPMDLDLLHVPTGQLAWEIIFTVT